MVNMMFEEEVDDQNIDFRCFLVNVASFQTIS